MKLERALFFLAAAFLVLVTNIALAATQLQYTVSLYKGTTKAGDYIASSETDAWTVCLNSLKQLQPSTTSKLTCKTPIATLISIPDPPIPVPVTGSATLMWQVPTQNTDGTPLTDLAGYTIRYGSAVAALTQTIDIQSAGTTSYVVQGLSSGTTYFTVEAYTSAGVHSDPSYVVSKTL